MSYIRCTKCGGYNGIIGNYVCQCFCGPQVAWDESPPARARRDLITVVLCVLRGAPADNLPPDCQGIVERFMRDHTIERRAGAESET
jgi:hypothetical protein